LSDKSWIYNETSNMKRKRRLWGFWTPKCSDICFFEEVKSHSSH